MEVTGSNPVAPTSDIFLMHSHLRVAVLFAWQNPHPRPARWRHCGLISPMKQLYVINFLRRAPARPIKPVASSESVAGSGTEAQGEPVTEAE